MWHVFSYVLVSFHMWWTVSICIGFFSYVLVSFHMYWSLFIYIGFFSYVMVPFHMYSHTHVYVWRDSMYEYFHVWLCFPPTISRNRYEVTDWVTKRLNIYKYYTNIDVALYVLGLIHWCVKWLANLWLRYHTVLIHMGWLRLVRSLKL